MSLRDPWMTPRYQRHHNWQRPGLPVWAPRTSKVRLWEVVAVLVVVSVLAALAVAVA